MIYFTHNLSYLIDDMIEIFDVEDEDSPESYEYCQTMIHLRFCSQEMMCPYHRMRSLSSESSSVAIRQLQNQKIEFFVVEFIGVPRTWRGLDYTDNPDDSTGVCISFQTTKRSCEVTMSQTPKWLSPTLRL